MIALFFMFGFMCMAITPTISSSGGKWRLKIQHAIAGAVIAISAAAGVVYVTQNGTTTTVNVPVASGVVIVPGSGWSGATDQPAQIGSFTQKAIARWDVVPYQSFSSDFNVGLVAYSSTDISRIDFAVKGGAWKTVTATAANPQTANSSGVGCSTDAAGKGVYSSGIVEYWGTLHATDFGTNEMVEVRAIAYPTSGVPRVVDSLYLVANPTAGRDIYVDSVSGNDNTGTGTSGSPFQTIKKAYDAFTANNAGLSNGNIYLKAGTYSLDDCSGLDSSSQNTYLTIQPATGVSRDSVVISPSVTYSENFVVKKVRWKNVTFSVSSESLAVMFYASNSAYHLWIDGCTLTGPSSETAYVFFEITSPGSIYVTDTTLTDTSDGIGQARLIRNVSIDRIGSDVLRGENMLVANVNSTRPRFMFSGTNLTVDGSDATLVTPDGYTPIAKNVEGVASYSLELTGGAGFSTTTSTTLTGSVTDVGTSITVAATTGYTAKFQVKIDNEWMRVTAVSGGTWTVERGVGGFQAAHSNGASVTIFYGITQISGGKWKLSHAPAATGTSGGTWNLFTGAHSDTFQWLGADTNTIFYGLKSDPGIASGISAGSQSQSGPLTDIAIIKCDIDATDGNPFGNGIYLGADCTNLFAYDTHFGGYSYLYQPGEVDGFVGEDVVFDTCDFDSPDANISSTSGVTVR